MGVRREVRSLVSECDVEERLTHVPPSARLRGLYFRNTDAVLEREGKLAEFKALYPEGHSAIAWYPLSDFLERAAVAAALLRGPSGIHEGLIELGRENPRSFSSSLLGKTMLRLLSKEPVRLLKQASAGRRQSCQYGRWEITFPSPNVGVMEMYEEYLWIESNVVGAATGTFEAVGLNISVTCELESPYRGRHIFRW